MNPHYSPLEEDSVKVTRTKGRGSHGMPIFFIRPALPCENRSRRYAGYKRKDDGVKRWFGPSVNFYLVDGHVIGSNTPTNALREYWRICDRDKIKKPFEVKLFQNQQP